VEEEILVDEEGVAVDGAEEEARRQTWNNKMTIRFGCRRWWLSGGNKTLRYPYSGAGGNARYSHGIVHDFCKEKKRLVGSSSC